MPPIPVGMLAAQTLDAGGSLAGSTNACSTRFSTPVAGMLTAPSSVAGVSEVLLVFAQIDASTLGLSFNGFENTVSGWQSTMQAAEALAHTNVLVDARDGHGGDISLAAYLFQQFRDQSAPSYLYLAGRGSFETPDTPALFAFPWSACGASQASSTTCGWSDIFAFTPNA